MKYYSTNKQVENVSLEEAVVKGLADDKGLFMPYEIKKLPAEFFENIDKMTLYSYTWKRATRLVTKAIST